MVDSARIHNSQILFYTVKNLFLNGDSNQINSTQIPFINYKIFNMKFKSITLTVFFLLTSLSYLNAQRTSTGIPTREPKADLQITALQISEKKTDNNGTTYYWEINYTIINNGAKSICKQDIGFNGYLTNSNPWDGDKFNGGCGAVADTKTPAGCPMLDPGQSTSGTFRCYKSNFGDFKYYVLWVNDDKIIAETNESNNQMIVLVAPRRTPGIGGN